MKKNRSRSHKPRNTAIASHNKGQIVFTGMAEITDIIGSKSCNIHNASMQHKTLEYPSIYSFKLLIDQKPHKMTQKYPKIQNSLTSARS